MAAELTGVQEHGLISRSWRSTRSVLGQAWAEGLQFQQSAASASDIRRKAPLGSAGLSPGFE